MSDKVIKMIRWESTDPTAMLEQLLERVRLAKKEERPYGVVVCIVEEIEEGKRTYDIGASPLPVETIVMAGEMIKDKAKYEWSNGE